MGDISLTSMTAWTQEEMQEFYNKCHGDDGRFCEGDSGTKVPVSGKMWGSKNYPEGLDVSGQEEREEVYDRARSTFDKNKSIRKEQGITTLDDAHQYYTSESYKFIRGRLEGDDHYSDTNGNPVPYSPEDNNLLDKKIGHLDTLFKTDSVSTNGASFFRGGKKRPELSYEPGSIIYDDSFLSTSASPASADIYSMVHENGDGVIMKIKTKNDTLGLMGNPFEREIVLNRGLPLKINTVASDLKTRTLLVEAEVL